MERRGTVFVVDDDARLRRAMVILLGECGFEARGFSSAPDFLEAYDGREEGCLLLDLRMPEQSGLELQEVLRSRGVILPIVFLTGHADVPTSVHAMKLGAVDFLEKPVSENVLLAALTRAMDVGHRARAERAEVAAAKRLFDTLTERERQVFWLLASGRLNKQAAQALGIALRTVKHHRTNVFVKLGVQSTGDLVHMALLLKRVQTADQAERWS